MEQNLTQTTQKVLIHVNLLKGFIELAYNQMLMNYILVI